MSLYLNERALAILYFSATPSFDTINPRKEWRTDGTENREKLSKVVAMVGHGTTIDENIVEIND